MRNKFQIEEIIIFEESWRERSFGNFEIDLKPIILASGLRTDEHKKYHAMLGARSKFNSFSETKGKQVFSGPPPKLTLALLDCSKSSTS